MYGMFSINDDDLHRLIGEEIQHLRLHSGLSQSALGAAAGVTQHAVHAYESGKGAITVARLCAVADALNVDPAHFLRVRRSGARPIAPDTSAMKARVDLLDQADLSLAAKISRIRDDASKRDIIASIERLVDAMALADAPTTIAGVTAG